MHVCLLGQLLGLGLSLRFGLRVQRGRHVQDLRLLLQAGCSFLLDARRCLSSLDVH